MLGFFPLKVQLLRSCQTCHATRADMVLTPFRESVVGAASMVVITSVVVLHCPQLVRESALQPFHDAALAQIVFEIGHSHSRWKEDSKFLFYS